MLTGGLGVSAIAMSIRLFGKEKTNAVVTNACVLFITLTLMLFISEFAVRFIFRDVTTTSDNSSYFARKWKLKNVRKNSLGYKEREFDLAKSDNIYRIAVIGDSLTFGQGVAEKDRFSNLIEVYLNSGGKSYQVLNFGKPGSETIDHLKVLKDVVLKTEPDFILLQWFVNDVEGNFKREEIKYLRLLPSDTLTSILQRYSAIYYLINRKWQSVQMAAGLSNNYVEYMHTRFRDSNSLHSLSASKVLKDFIHHCKIRKIDLGIVLFPLLSSDLDEMYPFTYLHDRVLECCAQEGIPCVDLRNSFAKHPRRKELWVNRFDAHPSALAHRIAADRLFEKFATVWLSRNDRSSNSK